MSEEALRDAFRDIAGEVRPAPEPYARLMARSRRRRLSHWLTGVAGVVAALVIAPVALNAADDPGPEPGPIDSHVLLITPWTRKLIDGPPSGALAGERRFLDEMAKALRDKDSGPMRGYPVKVLFAEDVAQKRLVIAVRHNKTHQVGVMMAGPRGASPQELANAQDGAIRMASLTPFTMVEFGYGFGQSLTQSGVAIAPPGCTVATAPQTPAAAPWTDSANGRYLVWSRTVSDLLVRVSCDGVVRYRGALLDMDSFVHVPGADLQEKLLVALGPAVERVPHQVIVSLVQTSYPPQTIGPMRLLHAGSVPGLANAVYLVADPVFDGVWRLRIHSGSGEMMLMTTENLTAGDAVVAVDVPDTSSPDRVVVVAPSEAVRVEVREKASGVLLHAADLVNGAAGIPAWGAESVTLRAFSASGTLVATGTAPLPSAPSTYTPTIPAPLTHWN